MHRGPRLWGRVACKEESEIGGIYVKEHAGDEEEKRQEDLGVEAREGGREETRRVPDGYLRVITGLKFSTGDPPHRVASGSSWHRHSHEHGKVG